VHADEGADDFKMAEFFSADVEEKIATGEIVDAVPALDGVLHGGGQFAVRAAELFKEHVAEADVGGSDVNRVHEFLDVVIHTFLRIEMTPEVGLDAGVGEVRSMKI
jgi:hypothetical protein